MSQEVLIVGAGPTGLCAALTLAQRGVCARIIDSKQHPIVTSNALGVHARTLEVWDELGIIAEAFALGNRIHALNLYTDNGALGQITLDQLPTEYPFILALPQKETERILTEHLLRYGVEIERGTTLEQLSDTAGGVQVKLDGEDAAFSWVIGCDGANSTVRREIAVDFPGDDLTEHFIMADLTLDWALPSDEANVFLANDGAVAFLPLTSDNFGRIICDVSGHPRLSAEGHPAVSDFQSLFDERSPVPGVLRNPEWISSFWIHSRLAASYRKGHVFLAGDAAHQHSPVGGQGMNIGIQDAHFLCQRLALVIQGKADHGVLDDYSEVRRAVGEEIVRKTERLTRLVSVRSPFLQAIRNVVMRIILKIPFIRKAIAMNISELIYR